MASTELLIACSEVGTATAGAVELFEGDNGSFAKASLAGVGPKIGASELGGVNGAAGGVEGSGVVAEAAAVAANASLIADETGAGAVTGADESVT